MTFEDLLESTAARVRKELEAETIESLPPELRFFGSKAKLLEVFEGAHVFYLGEAEDLERAAADILDDVEAGLDEGIPAPFDNMVVVFERPEGWCYEWHVRMRPYVAGLPGMTPEADPWLTVDLGQESRRRPVFSYMAICEVLRSSGSPATLFLWDPAPARAARMVDLPRQEAVAALTSGIFKAFRRIALIAHPANYIVRATPNLTPREERRRRDRGEVPVRKRPRYIVIDYERLVDLNPSARGGGGSRSPVPHSRRGHWMRLAERCRLARAEGKSRVWVKETYVGEREFADEKNQYLVLLSQKDKTERAASEPASGGVGSPAKEQCM